MSLGPGLPHPDDLDQPSQPTCEGCWEPIEGEPVMADDLPYCSRTCALLDETDDYEPTGVA